eukprot:s999_g6.t1
MVTCSPFQAEDDEFGGTRSPDISHYCLVSLLGSLFGRSIGLPCDDCGLWAQLERLGSRTRSPPAEAFLALLSFFHPCLLNGG